jgi:hypothetical protein
MIKKKIMQEYTPNTQVQENTFVKKATNVFNLALKVKEVAFLLSTVSLWILGLWLSYKLTPFVQNDRDANFRITAVETDVGTIRDDIKLIIEDVSEIKSDTSFIKGKLSQ